MTPRSTLYTVLSSNWINIQSPWITIPFQAGSWPFHNISLSTGNSIGTKRVIEMIAECRSPEISLRADNLPPFMIAASLWKEDISFSQQLVKKNLGVLKKFHAIQSAIVNLPSRRAYR